MNLKRYVPWWGKIAVKVALSHLPIKRDVWRSLSLFRFGAMDQPGVAYETFKRHFEATDFPHRGDGFTVLELGPGDSLFTALIARAHGATTTYLVDVGAFANGDLALYRAMADFLADRGLAVPDLAGIGSIPELLAACSARYETHGLASLRALPDQSVDFAFSNAVLEHVRRHEFLDTLREVRRVLRPSGSSSHSVDLRDHLGEALHNHRFSPRTWESDWMSRSGFYTNRIRYSEMLELFRQAGFDAEVVEVNRWERLPTPRSALAPMFRHFSDEDLCVMSFNVILRPA